MEMEKILQIKQFGVYQFQSAIIKFGDYEKDIVNSYVYEGTQKKVGEVELIHKKGLLYGESVRFSGDFDVLEKTAKRYYEESERIRIAKFEEEHYGKYKTPIAIIRRFLRIVEKAGYVAEPEDNGTGRCKYGSFYVWFFKKGSKRAEFKMRFSDHYLRQGYNQLPAGVIFERTYLSDCIRDFQFLVKHTRKMSLKEKEELWENKYEW